MSSRLTLIAGTAMISASSATAAETMHPRETGPYGKREP
jgi:hypothetical protein